MTEQLKQEHLHAADEGEVQHDRDSTRWDVRLAGPTTRSTPSRLPATLADKTEFGLHPLSCGASHLPTQRGSRKIAAILSAARSRRAAGTRKPVSPSMIISGTPPTAVQTAGRPAAIASSSAIGKHSTL